MTLLELNDNVRLSDRTFRTKCCDVTCQIHNCHEFVRSLHCSRLSVHIMCMLYDWKSNILKKLLKEIIYS